MKLALCISGQPRMYKKGFEELKKHYLDKYDVDVFIHTWKDTVYKGTEFYPEDVNSKQFGYSSSIFSDLVEMYNPKAILIEDQVKFVNPDFTGPTWRQSAQNCASMWYSIFKANELRDYYQLMTDAEYDFVIRTRTDLQFEMVLNDFDSYDPNKITTYKWKTSYPQNTYGYKDCFAIGGGHAMDLYSDLYRYLAYYMKEDPQYIKAINNEDHIRNEYLLKWHLANMRIGVNEIDTMTDKIGFSIIR